MTEVNSNSPSLDRLFELAAAQDGHFTARQARDAGYSPQLITHHCNTNRFHRIRRGIYRLSHYPPGEHEDLVVLWLWSEHEGVFSHQTALALHDLSDALPSGVHMTLPDAWRKRRLRVPKGLVTYHGDIPDIGRQWFGPVPATSALRTLIDCSQSNLPPDWLKSAAHQALARGLVSLDELDVVSAALEPFGGLDA